jgi:hypothetical protein
MDVSGVPSSRTLRDEHADALETALWAAQRALHERAGLTNRIASMEELASRNA